MQLLTKKSVSDKYNTSRHDPKLFVYGYVFHRKSPEIQACWQNGFKSKDLRHASTRDLPSCCTSHSLSPRHHHSKLVVLCLLTFLSFFQQEPCVALRRALLGLTCELQLFTNQQ